MTKKELELAGIILYKCEGTKLFKDKRYPNTFFYAMDFANSDPLLIELWLDFIRKILKVREEKLRVILHLYSDLDKNQVRRFWSNVTKIPQRQFYNTKIHQAMNSKYKPNPLGTCKIRYVDKETYLRFNEIIKKRLGKKAKLM